MDYSKIEGIILNKIFEEDNIADWKQYKENIIRNFNNINYIESIENYVPCERKLYLTRPKMRTLLYFMLQKNKNIFKEVGYEQYEGRKERISFNDVTIFVEECVKILVKKQQGV
jgi:hypothetical protein